VYITDDGSDYGRALAHALTQAASQHKLTVTSTASAAKAVFDAAASPSAAARFLNATAASNPGAQLFGPSALFTPAFSTALSPAARSRMHVSVPGIPTRGLNAAGRTFRSDFAAAYGHDPSTEAIFGYAAMAALLHVIADQGAAANDRAKVIKGFLSIKDLPSVLGPYSINASGDTSFTHFVLLRPGGG
jgi:ABC-type branched-subunit amino acid transport system substrate-binding protein